MRIEYKSAALRDITETRDYIRNTLKNRQAAQKLVTAILHAVSLLADNPMMGTPLDSKYELDTDIRFLVVAKQLVFYRLAGDDLISVIRVLDGRQDYLAILFG